MKPGEEKTRNDADEHGLMQESGSRIRYTEWELKDRHYDALRQYSRTVPGKGSDSAIKHGTTQNARETTPLR